MLAQIDSRVARIQEMTHFGDAKYLGKGLAELRWKSGIRIYFARFGDKIVLLLNGGRKNAQKKEIIQASKTSPSKVCQSIV